MVFFHLKLANNPCLRLQITFNSHIFAKLLWFLVERLLWNPLFLCTYAIPWLCILWQWFLSDMLSMWHFFKVHVTFTWLDDKQETFDGHIHMILWPKISFEDSNLYDFDFLDPDVSRINKIVTFLPLKCCQISSSIG